jgi:hypothetical protein
MRKDTATPLDALIAQLEAMAARYRRQAQQQRLTDAEKTAYDSIEAEILHDRLCCAQSLRAGCLPDSGALNNVRYTEEARYAAFN